MYLVKSDKLQMRHDAQSADASDRLATIRDARAEALSKITAALDEFIECFDRERVDERDTSEKTRRTVIECFAENLDDIALPAVVSVEEKLHGEGQWSIYEAAEHHHDRREDR